VLPCFLCKLIFHFWMSLILCFYTLLIYFPVTVRRLKWIGHMPAAKERTHQVTFSFIFSAVFQCPLLVHGFWWVILSSCQGISTYLLVIWVQRLLMQLYMRASRSFLVARKFLAFCFLLSCICNGLGQVQTKYFVIWHFALFCVLFFKQYLQMC